MEHIYPSLIDKVCCAMPEEVKVPCRSCTKALKHAERIQKCVTLSAQNNITPNKLLLGHTPDVLKLFVSGSTYYVHVTEGTGRCNFDDHA